MLKRVLPIMLLILLCIPQEGEAQRWKLRRYEAVFGVGFLNYFGDVGGAATNDNLFGLKDLSIKHTRPSSYLGIRFKVRENMGLKLNFMYGFIAGDDEGSKNNDRGFSFTSSVFEPSLQFEYSIISEEKRYSSSALFNKRGMVNNYSQINLYLYAGIGGVFFNPKVNDAMKNAPAYIPDYSTSAISLPVGIGLKYVINQNWSVGGEFGVRLTTTDYMDAFSHPVFSKANDLYYFGFINGIYRIRTSKSGAPIIFGKKSKTFL
jgi:opacity protein-like surface antigen